MKFYVNKNAQPTGEHEVHRFICDRLPDPENRLYLGDLASSRQALIEAKKRYNNVDGCAYCCPEIHTR